MKRRNFLAGLTGISFLHKDDQVLSTTTFKHQEYSQGFTFEPFTQNDVLTAKRLNRSFDEIQTAYREYCNAMVLAPKTGKR